MGKAKAGIVKWPDGRVAGRIISGKEGPNKVVCVLAYNMKTAKAFVRSHGWTILETEARGPRENRNYCFYLGKRRRR